MSSGAGSRQVSGLTSNCRAIAAAGSNFLEERRRRCRSGEMPKILAGNSFTQGLASNPHSVTGQSQLDEGGIAEKFARENPEDELSRILEENLAKIRPENMSKILLENLVKNLPENLEKTWGGASAEDSA